MNYKLFLHQLKLDEKEYVDRMHKEWLLERCIEFVTEVMEILDIKYYPTLKCFEKANKDNYHTFILENFGALTLRKEMKLPSKKEWHEKYEFKR